MKKQKNEGITIIGLAVTIIVMLLLAGATISSIVGQKGIFANMNKTQNQTRLDEEKRILKASVVNAMSKDSVGNVTKDNLSQSLDQTVDEKYTIASEGNGVLKVTFEETKNEYYVFEDGTISSKNEYETNVIFAITPTTIPALKINQEKKIKTITNTENAELKWKSNDESIVKIVGNSTNEITIKGVAVGKAQIQAYLEIKNKSGQIEKVKTEVCNITVVSESQTPVEEIDFSMISGEQKRTIDLSSPVTTCELKPIIYPESARDSVELEWESSNPEVASVDENGIVTGNKNGTAVITVRTNNGKHAETTVEVQTSPTEIVLNAAELQIDIAQAQHTKLEAAIKPVTANVKTGITWSSSNSDVASVNQTGEVEAKSTGKTVISVVTENGGMSWMDDGISMKTTTNGGIMKGLGRALAGESIFMNVYTAEKDDAEIAFASSFPGQILEFDLKEGETIIAQKRAFLCAEPTVDISMHFRKRIGAGFFGGEGFIMQKFQGPGRVFLELDGAIYKRELADGQKLKVDNGYVAVMTSGVDLNIETVKGVKNIVFGGEGLFLTTLKGPGTVWIQSMPISKLASMFYVGGNH